MTRFSLIFSIMALILVMTPILAASRQNSADKFERRVPYFGLKMFSPVVLCKAKNMAAGGFWRDPRDGTIDEGARIETEPEYTFWKISISVEEQIAKVIRFNANSEALEDPVSFSVEVTPAGGILLTKANRIFGQSPETISIDPSNSSFVYSSQQVTPWWNRANIWYGSCQPHS